MALQVNQEQVQSPVSHCQALLVLGLDHEGSVPSRSGLGQPGPALAIPAGNRLASLVRTTVMATPNPVGQGKPGLVRAMSRQASQRFLSETVRGTSQGQVKHVRATVMPPSPGQTSRSHTKAKFRPGQGTSPAKIARPGRSQPGLGTGQGYSSRVSARPGESCPWSSGRDQARPAW